MTQSEPTGCSEQATWDRVGAPVRVRQHDHDESMRCPLAALSTPPPSLVDALIDELGFAYGALNDPEALGEQAKARIGRWLDRYPEVGAPHDPE